MEENKHTSLEETERYICETERKVPVVAEVDVLVLGGGPAGVSAAIIAGREGVRTMLVEQLGDVGGMATSGLMSHWTGKTRGGIYEEIIERSFEGEGFSHSERESKGQDNRQIIHAEKLKSVLYEMLEESNVEVKLYTMAVEPIMKHNMICGILTESKSGREAILSKIVIDCTGDGDIAARAGVPCVLGREKDQKMQPATLMFKVAGVNVQKAILPGAFEENLSFPVEEDSLLQKEGFKEIKIQDLGRMKLHHPIGHVLLYRSSLPGVVTCNMTNFLDVDGTKADNLTKATIACRKQISEIVAFLQEYVPGFENCYLMSAASLIGIRETRHFKGEKVITETDIQEAKVFKDWVVTNAWFNFDVHNMQGNGLDETGVQKDFKQNKGYTIPYGCFVPVKVDNLLLAGRDISGTHMAHSNYRAMPICANMGEAVGIAASLCVKNKVIPRKLNVKWIQKRLIELGVSP